ncbi:MAG: hypothetical protein M1378_13620 [Bacteroidetes bacterium]|nr:hypothetical protein [Bacteroidota bacterium]
MKPILAVTILMIASCSTLDSPSLDQPVVLENRAAVSLFYNVVGLQTSYRIDPAPTIPIADNRLPELKAGNQVSLQAISTYEREEGIAVFIYKVASIEGTAVLQFAATRQATYDELKAGKPINLR